MDNTQQKISWTHNPTYGTVIGIVITKPKVLDWVEKFTVSVMIKDSSKRTWRVRSNSSTARSLLACEIGQKLKLEGIKGDLCACAWDNAKRQIVPHSIKIKN